MGLKWDKPFTNWIVLDCSLLTCMKWWWDIWVLRWTQNNSESDVAWCTSSWENFMIVWKAVLHISKPDLALADLAGFCGVHNGPHQPYTIDDLTRLKTAKITGKTKRSIQMHQLWHVSQWEKKTSFHHQHCSKFWMYPHVHAPISCIHFIVCPSSSCVCVCVCIYIYVYIYICIIWSLLESLPTHIQYPPKRNPGSGLGPLGSVHFVPKKWGEHFLKMLAGWGSNSAPMAGTPPQPPIRATRWALSTSIAHPWRQDDRWFWEMRIFRKFATIVWNRHITMEQLTG